MYLDSGLSENTEYTYTVKARDRSFERNETAPSQGDSAITSCSSDTLIFNGGFEDGNGGDFGVAHILGWGTIGTDGVHHNIAGQTIGTKSIHIYGPETAIYQEIFDILGNYYYTVSAYAGSFSDDALVGAEGIVEVVWLTWSIEVGREMISKKVQAPAGAESMEIVLGLQNLTSEEFSGSVNFDDVSISADGPVMCLAGDLNMDCRTDVEDLAVLSGQWQEAYSLVEMAKIIEKWLWCIRYDQVDCN